MGMPATDRPRTTSKALVATLVLALGAVIAGLGYGMIDNPPGPPTAVPAVTPTTTPESAPAIAAPVERGVSVLSPEDHDDRTSILEVTLHPGDVALQRVAFRVQDLDGRTTSACTTEPGQPFWAPLHVPTGRWVVVSAETLAPGQPSGPLVLGPRLRVGPGEVRRVDLYIEGPATTLRVVGPSARLQPHLLVEVTTLESRPRVFQATLRADGTLPCYLPPPTVRARLLLANDSDCPLQAADGTFDLDARGGTLAVHPLQPVVGLVLGTPGAERPAALALDQPAPIERLRPCSAVLAAAAEASTLLHGWTPDEGAFTLPITAMHRIGDVWYATPTQTTRMATLTVERLPNAASTAAPDLLAEALDGTAPVRLEATPTQWRGTLPPGDYRLVWQLRGQRGAIAHEPLALGPGAAITLRLQPPTAPRWTMLLRNVPPERAYRLFLALGPATSLGSADEGTFTIDLLEPPHENTPAELFSPVLQCRFPARLSRIDTATLHAEVDSAVADASWSRIVALPLANGPAAIRLLSGDAAHHGRTANLLESPVELPLLPGTERRGCTLERIDGRLQLIGWFHLAHGTRELPVEPRGRWTTLRIERPLVRAQVFASGDGDLTTDLFTIDRTGDFALFVADGTRAFHVDLEPGGRITLPADGPLLVR